MQHACANLEDVPQAKEPKFERLLKEALKPRVDVVGERPNFEAEPPTWITTMLVSEDRRDIWKLTFEVEMSITGEVRRFVVMPGEDKPVVARDLRIVPFGEIEAAARVATTKAFARAAETLGEAITLETDAATRKRLSARASAARKIADASAARPRTGPKPPSDTEVAVICRLYVEAVDAGVKKPAVVIGKLLGKSPAAISSVIHKARVGDNPLLSKTIRGRSGGTLTDYAKQLLAEGTD